MPAPMQVVRSVKIEEKMVPRMRLFQPARSPPSAPPGRAGSSWLSVGALMRSFASGSEFMLPSSSIGKTRVRDVRCLVRVN